MSKRTKSKQELQLKEYFEKELGFIYKKDFFTDYNLELSSLTPNNKKEIASVDFAFPLQKIAISLVGVGGHTGFKVYLKDVRASNYLISQGWQYYTLVNSEVGAIRCGDYEHEREWFKHAINLVNLTRAKK
jgi:hypothetical protein